MSSAGLRLLADELAGLLQEGFEQILSRQRQRRIAARYGVNGGDRQEILYGQGYQTGALTLAIQETARHDADDIERRHDTQQSRK